MSGRSVPHAGLALLLMLATVAAALPLAAQPETASATLVQGHDNRADAEVLAFVGERVSVRPTEVALAPGEILMDAAFTAEYRVRDVLHGRYGGESIRFLVFDHYGEPAFARHRGPVVLFLRPASDGGWVQVKYQYIPLFDTRDHGLAACAASPQVAAAAPVEPVDAPTLMRFGAETAEVFAGRRDEIRSGAIPPQMYTREGRGLRCRLGLTPAQAARRWFARRAADRAAARAAEPVR